MPVLSRPRLRRHPGYLPTAPVPVRTPRPRVEGLTWSHLCGAILILAGILAGARYGSDGALQVSTSLRALLAVTPGIVLLTLDWWRTRVTTSLAWLALGLTAPVLWPLVWLAWVILAPAFHT